MYNPSTVGVGGGIPSGMSTGGMVLTYGVVVPQPAEYLEKFNELQTAIVGAIRNVKIHIAPVTDSTAGVTVLETSKLVVQGVMQLRAVVSGMVRPYFIYQIDLTKNCKFIEQVLVVRQFPTWVLSNPQSYLVIPNEPTATITDTPDPQDLNQISLDVRSCPRWILRRVYELSQNAHKVEEQQDTLKRQMGELQAKSKVFDHVTNPVELEKLKPPVDPQKKTITELNGKLQPTQGETVLEAEQSNVNFTQKERDLGLEISELKAQISVLQAELEKQLQQSAAVENSNRQKDEELKRVNGVLEKQNEHINMLKWALSQLHTNQLVSKKKEKDLLTLLEQRDKELQASKLESPIITQYQQNQYQVSEPTLEEQDLLKLSGPAIGVDFIIANQWMSEVERRELLVSLILDKNHGFDFIRLLEKVFVPQEAEQCISLLINLFSQQGREMELIFKMIELECSTAATHFQLFRSEEFPPRCIRVFTRLKGLPFAKEVVGDLIHEAIDTNLTIKFNIDDDEAPVDEEIMKDVLNQWSQRFLDAIIGSVHKFPIEFRRIANHLTKQTYKRWQDLAAVQGSIAGFVFLRFFCPCIASPKNFGLRDPPLNTMKSLLLIGKVIQSLANGVASFKEPHLKCMNPFLEKNKQNIENFVRLVREWPPSINGNSDSAIELAAMMSKSKSKEKINSLLKQQPNFGHILDTVWDCLSETDPLTRTSNMMSNLPKINSKDKQFRFEVVDRSKFPSDPYSPLIKALRLSFIDSDTVIVAATRVLVDNKDTGCNVRNTVVAMGNIFLANSSFRFFLDTLIFTEISENITTRIFLSHSLTSMLFQTVCKEKFSGWLLASWRGVISEILATGQSLEVERVEDIKGDPKAAFRKLSQFSHQLFEGIFQNLENAPLLFWELCSTLVENEEYLQISAFEFIFLNYFAKAIEAPQNYSICDRTYGRLEQLPTRAEKPKPNPSRAFELLSDLMRSIASASETSIGNFINEPGMIARYQKRFYEWIQSGVVGEEPTHVDWLQEREALCDLSDFILVNKPAFDEAIAGALGVAHRVSYGVKELLDSLEDTVFVQRPLPMLSPRSGDVASVPPKSAPGNEKKKEKSKQKFKSLKKDKNKG